MNSWARLRARLSATDRERRLRLEHFGAIVQLRRPRALVFVDREYARGLGVSASERWTNEDDQQIGDRPLAAPLEAHLQLTNRCASACQGCYTAASPEASNEMSLEQWKSAIDALAKMGVFHLALGGGESADLPWLGELAEHAHSKGLVPNLTTSGLSNLKRLLGIAKLFGQINVSIDGLGADYAKVRGFDGFDEADAAVKALRATTKSVGINVVVTRRNFDKLDEIVRYARRRRLNEVELLRFKPAGRGIQAYSSLKCFDSQHRSLLPTILASAKRHRMRLRVDCSYFPMLAHHTPTTELLASLAVYGCTGGDFLVGANARGQASACSFATIAPNGPKIAELEEYWPNDGAFEAFRTWRSCEEPCQSCSYHDLCRGGCKVVSRHVLGDERLPDPECPRVVDFKNRGTQN